jgi:DNA-binding CsgD family transcriptional regulator
VLPYLPFTELLGRLAQTSPELVSSLVEAHPAARHLLPGQRMLVGGQAGGVADVERSTLFETVHAVLERIAASGPALVVLEDLHWADRSTRDLLGFLFQRGFTAPVSLVASYRSDDLHRRHPLRSSVAQWSRLPRVHRTQLGRLSDPDVKALVTAAHEGSVTEGEVQEIVTRAEGNAFFAEELLAAAEAGGRGLPDDLADLLLVRVDQLDEDARRVVRAASCAGRRVDHDLLAAVVDLDAGALDQALRAAVDSNVLVASGSGYTFRHALLAEAVYDDLLPGERVRIHGAYCAALCSRVVDGTAAELARHARAAHEVVTAVTASIEAGDDAMAVGGPEDAARHYQLALELLGEPQSRPAGLEDVDVVSLTGRASDALLASGRPHRAMKLVGDQLGQLPAGAADADRARLLTTLAGATLMTDSDTDALQLTTEALGLVGAEPTVLRARLLGLHARANAERQRVDEATRWAGEAVELGQQLGASRVVLDAATTLARIEERAGDPAASQRTFEKIVAQARADGDVTAELRGLHHLGALHFELGRFAEAAEAYASATARAVETGRPWAPYGLDSRVMGSITAYVAGRWDDAVTLCDLVGETAPGMAEALLRSAGLMVAAGRGDRDALDVLARVRPWWDRDGFVAILSGAAAIDLHGDAGEVDAALEVHADVEAAVTSLWQISTFMGQVRLAALLLGQLATHVGAAGGSHRRLWVARGGELVASAHEAVADAEARGRRIGPEGVAWVARVEAEHLRLRWRGGVDSPDEDELLAAWERAAVAFGELGHVFETARTRARLAEVLRSLGRAADARAHADHAREVAHRLGAAPLLTELRASGSSPQPAGARAPEPALTPREHEILALVATGRTNGEIARQLFISVKTVSVHVSNILAKLGAGGRTEAAALARRRGLLD